MQDVIQGVGTDSEATLRKVEHQVALFFYGRELVAQIDKELGGFCQNMSQYFEIKRDCHLNVVIAAQSFYNQELN